MHLNGLIPYLVNPLGLLTIFAAWVCLWGTVLAWFPLFVIRRAQITPEE